MKLVIIGGVAAGATAAARARRLDEGAEIVLLERTSHVSIASCGLPYHIGDEIPRREGLLVGTAEGLRKRYRIDVRPRNEAVAIDRAARAVQVREIESGRLYAEPYDRLILSPGAAPLRPPIPGVDGPRIFGLRGMEDMDAIRRAIDGGARRALVVGGGFIGLEVTENLRRRGVEVDLVEMLPQVLPPIDPEMATPIHEELRRNGVRLHLRELVRAFEARGDRVAAVLSGGGEIEADLVVLGTGVRPEVSLAREAGLEIGPMGGIRVDKYLRTSDPRIFAAGDAIEVKDLVLDGPALIPLAGPANRQGRIAADNSLGRLSVYSGTLGTSIVRVFGLAAARTGASEKALRGAGVRHEKVYIHPLHHAGYFPGARPMTLKLLFAPDGRVLGAQAIGSEGIDKRIDCVAAAIGARGTVFDLEAMELSYAPQFGSAKDPVNLAGFAAANVLRGDARIVHAEALSPEAFFLIDVRTPLEHASGHIEGSANIPVDDLRARIAEVPRDRPVAVYCQVGLRGYVAARILKGNGIGAWNLSGGWKTWRMVHPEKV